MKKYNRRLSKFRNSKQNNKEKEMYKSGFSKWLSESTNLLTAFSIMLSSIIFTHTISSEKFMIILSAILMFITIRIWRHINKSYVLFKGDIRFYFDDILVKILLCIIELVLWLSWGVMYYKTSFLLFKILFPLVFLSFPAIIIYEIKKNNRVIISDLIISIIIFINYYLLEFRTDQYYSIIENALLILK